MMNRTPVPRSAALILLSSLLIPSGSQGLLAQAGEAPPHPPEAEGVVRTLYDIVTFPEGTTPDWDRARTLFLPEAVVVLRTSRTGNTVFSVEGWIGDFEDFIERAGVEETGFVERIIRTHTTVFGDIAQVWVLYEAQVPGSGQPSQEGVDAVQLVRRDGRWLIASILNELPVLAGDLPPFLSGDGGA